MDLKATRTYVASIDGDTYYTSFKWCLNHWTELHGSYYNKTLKSPECEIVGAKDHKFWLQFNPSQSAVYGYGTSPVSVQITGKFTDCSTHMSIVNKEMAKLFGPITGKPSADVYYGEPGNITFQFHPDPSLDKYVKDNTLTLFFELYHTKRIKQTVIETARTRNFSNRMWNKLVDLLNTNEFGDVTFRIGKTSLTENKLLLAAHSKVFQAMFQSGMKEQTEHLIQLNDVDAKIFETFLGWMRTGKVADMGKAATKLALVADKYLVFDLVNDCTDYMIAHLEVGNAIEYLVTGDKLRCLTLVERAIRFIKNKRLLADPANYKLLSDHSDLMIRVLSI